MFLRNYDNMLVLMQFDTVSANTYPSNYTSSDRYINNSSAWGDGYCNVKRTNGAVNGFRLGTSGSNGTVAFWASLQEFNICLGDGTEEVSYEDYRLSGNVIDNQKLASVSFSTVYDSDSHKFKRTAVHTYTNDSANPITISEWGIFHNFNMSSYQSGVQLLFNNASSEHTLLYREVLDEPIVIEPGTTATLNFTIEIPMANHP